jgi:hypothetical protein
MAFTHEVETAFRKGQLGIQTEYATPVAATIALGSVSLNPQIKRFTKKFTPKGRLLPTVLKRGVKYTEIGFDGEGTYEDIGYFLKDVVSDAQATPVIYTAEAGGLQIGGAIVSAITLKGNKDDVTVSGTMLGREGTVAAPTGGLTIPEQTPILATGVVITIDSAEMTKVFDWELSLADIWGAVAFVGDTTFVNALQKQINATFKVKVESDSDGLGLLSTDDVVACSIVATTGAKVLTIAFDAKVGEPGPFSDEDGIYAIEHNLTIMDKATKAISVTIV